MLAIFFNRVFTLRQFRITQRLRVLAKLLLDLEKTVELDKTRAVNYTKFARSVEVRVGYWVTVLLVGFTAYLIYLLFQYLKDYVGSENVEAKNVTFSQLFQPKKQKRVF